MNQSISILFILYLTRFHIAYLANLHMHASLICTSILKVIILSSEYFIISKEKQQNMNPASWKLTGEETLIPITHQQQNMDLMEVDWGGNIDPNHSSSGCMLMQVGSEENSESTI